jgi:hypothetical protein
MSSFAQTVENTAATPLYVSSVSGGSAPTGAATEAKQDTGNTTLGSILSAVATSALQTAATVVLTAIRDRLPPAIGLQTMANALSICIASDSPFGLANKPVSAISTPAPVVGNAAAQQLPSSVCTSGCWISVSDLTTAGAAVSTTGARIGDSNVSATRGRELAIGDEKWFPVANTNLLYFYGAATCTIQITVA